MQCSKIQSKLFVFIGEIALAAQAVPPTPTHLSVAWSVCCRLSHSCTLLKPLDEFRCLLAGTLWAPMTHCAGWCL